MVELNKFEELKRNGEMLLKESIISTSSLTPRERNELIEKAYDTLLTPFQGCLSEESLDERDSIMIDLFCSGIKQHDIVVPWRVDLDDVFMIVSGDIYEIFMLFNQIEYYLIFYCEDRGYHSFGSSETPNATDAIMYADEEYVNSQSSVEAELWDFMSEPARLKKLVDILEEKLGAGFEYSYSPYGSKEVVLYPVENSLFKDLELLSYASDDLIIDFADSDLLETIVGVNDRLGSSLYDRSSFYRYAAEEREVKGDEFAIFDFFRFTEPYKGE